MATPKIQFSDSWQPLTTATPSGPNQFLYGYNGVNHPITLSIISQLSQDIFSSVRVSGQSDSVEGAARILGSNGWRGYIIESLYQALLQGKSYLILDFGDPQENWTEPPEGSSLKPFKVIHQEPSMTTALGLAFGSGMIHPVRWIQFNSPYRFNLTATLNSELAKHDAITKGIESTVSGQGIVRTGIENLYEIMLKGGSVLSGLRDRLANLKQATKGDGVLAYDLKREDIEVSMKAITREHETLGVIENRISAITGLPSFIIWGHTDGDGYGVKTSLDLYSQRLSALAQQTLTDNLAYLFELIDESLDVRVIPTDIYPEKQSDTVDRFHKMVDGLAILQSIGAVTSIEVRDSVASYPEFGLVLNPNPTVVTPGDPN